LDGCPDAETNAAKKVKVWISESSLVVFCGKTRKKKMTAPNNMWEKQKTMICGKDLVLRINGERTMVGLDKF
jgi:hypothetical protein